MDTELFEELTAGERVGLFNPAIWPEMPIGRVKLLAKKEEKALVTVMLHGEPKDVWFDRESLRPVFYDELEEAKNHYEFMHSMFSMLLEEIGDEEVAEQLEEASLRVYHLFTRIREERMPFPETRKEKTPC